MSANELGLKTRGGATDPVKGKRVRVFYVDRAPDSALTDPELPQPNSIYPTQGPGTLFPLKLDSYDWEVAENGNTYVYCNYSNDRTGRLSPHPDTTHPDFKGWDIDEQDTSIDWPTLVRYRLKVPGESGGTAYTPAVDPTIYKIAESLTIFSRRVVLTNVTAVDLAKIRAQNGHLHKLPDGNVYRFKSGRATQTEVNAYETSYTFISDPGTPAPGHWRGAAYPESGVIPIPPAAEEREFYGPPVEQNNLIYLDPTLNDGKRYTRSPFHIIDYVLDKDFKPIWHQFCPYTYEPNGWQQLPGSIF